MRKTSEPPSLSPAISLGVLISMKPWFCNASRKRRDTPLRTRMMALLEGTWAVGTTVAGAVVVSVIGGLPRVAGYCQLQGVLLELFSVLLTVIKCISHRGGRVG